MGCMAGLIPLWAGVAADGMTAHFGFVLAEPGAKFAWGRNRTFGSERVDIVGGLGIVGGQLCAGRAFGSGLVVFGSDLAV